MARTRSPTGHDGFVKFDLGGYALCLLPMKDLAADLQIRYPGQTLSRDELVDEACLALQDLRCYWVEHAPRHAPRRVDKTPGRNDPCPCGSGRKYKKCHGAA